MSRAWPDTGWVWRGSSWMRVTIALISREVKRIGLRRTNLGDAVSSRAQSNQVKDRAQLSEHFKTGEAGPRSRLAPRDDCRTAGKHPDSHPAFLSRSERVTVSNHFSRRLGPAARSIRTRPSPTMLGPRNCCCFPTRRRNRRGGLYERFDRKRPQK